MYILGVCLTISFDCVVKESINWDWLMPVACSFSKIRNVVNYPAITNYQKLFSLQYENWKHVDTWAKPKGLLVYLLNTEQNLLGNSHSSFHSNHALLIMVTNRLTR